MRASLGIRLCRPVYADLPQGEVVTRSRGLPAPGGYWQPEQLVGQAPASTSTHVGAASPTALQHIFHGGQHAPPQHT
jgi:hypothetical protein